MRVCVDFDSGGRRQEPFEPGLVCLTILACWNDLDEDLSHAR